MKLSYATHQEVDVKVGKISVIATDNPVVYRDMVFGFRGKNDLLRVYDDQFEEQKIESTIDWLGDVADAEFDVKKYVTEISKTTMAGLTENNRNKTIEAIQNLYNVIQSDLFMVDLPLQVAVDLDLKRALTFCKVHFDEGVMNNPYGIIESVIKVHEECSIGNCVALTNVAHYLDAEQFKDLCALIKDSGLSMIIIEFTELEFQEFYKECDFTFIDQDFVDWHG
ncbi:type II-A CRISPR-associated protein Csn2 [Lentilactobacillus sp. SPB1-3]|uniref:Type II-A CRISPR-associated protein Csn2 n=1 Tax=Lentilactobacillus terminaliae TaxID=3003483 RepID=A0ACD5DFV6_9LACO|nr:type II-A CRISPR-associated protein Csn2 [Lentilactobacillus sp. SPB1-3]MCZ0976635.1 type II-A CRISPR-associated protein Csn2 [Lentilactobacillus sp. SPB1-3]